jgi:ABC-type sugar transport system substrate-binding protein
MKRVIGRGSRKWLSAVGVAGAAAAVLVATTAGGGVAAAAGTVRVGLILPDVSNPFIGAEQLGAVNEARKFGIDLLVKGSNDGETQVNDFETDLSSGVSLLGINTIDGQAMGVAVKQANAKSVPVIGMQSAPSAGKLVTFISSNNTAAGVTIGNGIAQYCAKLKLCQVGIIEGSLADPSGVDENNGVLGVLKKHSNISVVGEAPTNYDPETALSVGESLLTAHPKINFIYTWWDQGAQAAEQAVKAKGLTGKVGISGFSGSCPALEDVLAGRLTYDLMEFPLLQGKLFIDDAHKYLSGNHSIPAQTVIPGIGVTTALAHSVLAGKTKEPSYVLQALQQAQGGCKGL